MRTAHYIFHAVYFAVAKGRLLLDIGLHCICLVTIMHVYYLYDLAAGGNIFSLRHRGCLFSNVLICLRRGERIPMYSPLMVLDFYSPRTLPLNRSLFIFSSRWMERNPTLPRRFARYLFMTSPPAMVVGL